MRLLERYFELSRHGTDVRTEVRAGLTTFLAMAYIVPVNAAIMSLAGMPHEALITATALITLLATVLNGLWANTPVAMSVGMGLNAYFTFGLVKGMGLPWQTALGVVMLSGLIFLVLSLTPLRAWLIRSVPMALKRAVTAGIGLFIAFIGLQGMGLIVDSEATLVTLGDLTAPQVLIGLFALAVALWLHVRRVRAAFLIAIVASLIPAWLLDAVTLPEQVVAWPASIAPIALAFDLGAAFSLALVPVVITFLITDMFDTVGTLSAVGARAGLLQDERRLQRTLQADAAATVMGAAAGVSTTTAFIESAAGVEAGGRTGLTAVVTGLLFGVLLFFLPLFQVLPAGGIFAVLVAVGLLMFSELRHLDFDDPVVLVSAFFTVFLMPLTYSITLGLSAGFIVWLLMSLATGRRDNLTPTSVILALLGVMGFVFHG